ncbi:MAG TPA: lysylphosphatidylglycerol synthase transmembrane domain-containing protein [Polyangia bacterium]|nr:lysylphosphatidylglycerol synthase transmembrane domain-containing protein [Polyangia bacterium]
MTPAKRVASAALRIGVVGAALWFVVRGVAWDAVAASLKQARPALLLGVVALNAAMMSVKAARLRLLLQGGASLRSCLLAKLTASAVNNVLPFRGGDMARLWMLERHAGISKSAAAAIAVLEALFELVTLGVIALLGSLGAPGERWAAGAAAVLGLVATTLLIASRWVTHLPRWARELATRVEPGVRALRDRGIVAKSAALSAVAWGLEVVMIMTCARALQLSIGPALAAVILLGINLALAVPSSPAGAGAFEGAVVVVLTLAGLGKSEAVAFALLYHLIQVVPVTLAGALVVWRAGLTLDRLPAAVEAQASPITRAMASPSQPFTPTV